MARTTGPPSYWRRVDRPRTGDGVLLAWRQRERWQDAEEVGSIGSGSSSAHTDKGKKGQSKTAAFELNGNKKFESHGIVEHGGSLYGVLSTLQGEKSRSVVQTCN